MKKFLSLILVLSLYNTSFSQDNLTIKKLKEELNRSVKRDMVDTVPWTWVKGGVININGTQGSLRNWAAGGDKFSIAVNSYVNYYVFYRNGRANWDNTMDFNFGFLHSTSTGSRILTASGFLLLWAILEPNFLMATLTPEIIRNCHLLFCRLLMPCYQ
jgi:hypothetical protein